MPSDPASSILLSRSAVLLSVLPTYPSFDGIPRRSGANAHSVSRQVPVPNTILSDAPLNTSFATFHTFQSDTPSPPGDAGPDNTDRLLTKYS